MIVPGRRYYLGRLRLEICSLPGSHGGRSYWSIGVGLLGRAGVRLSFGGYDLGWKIIRYRRIATHFSFGAGCVSFVNTMNL